MKLWKHNRLDAEWEKANDELVAEFFASQWADTTEWPWPLDRRIMAFLSETTESVYDPDDFNQLADMICDEQRRRQRPVAAKPKPKPRQPKRAGTRSLSSLLP